MADGRWQFIADRVRTADSTITVGTRICVVASDLLKAKSVSLALVIDGLVIPADSGDR